MTYSKRYTHALQLTRYIYSDAYCYYCAAAVYTTIVSSTASELTRTLYTFAHMHTHTHYTIQDAVGTALQGQRAPPLPSNSSPNTTSDGLDDLPALGSGLLSGKLTIRLSADLAVGADVRRVSRSAASLAAVGSTARPHAAAATLGALAEHSSTGAVSSGQRSSLKVTTAGFATSSGTGLGSPVGAVVQRHTLLSSPLQVKVGAELLRPMK